MATRRSRYAAQASDAYWSVPAERLLSDLAGSLAGLSADEAERRLEYYGPNSLREQRQYTLGSVLFSQITNPLTLILLFAAAVSVIAQEWTDAAVIVAIVAASTIISFTQEYSASRAVAALRARLAHMVTVMRDGTAQTIPAATVVPGDIVVLAAGALIPADGILLSAKECYVTEAVLTGETFPVLKTPGPTAADSALSERTGSVFLGTTVRSGTGTLLVVHTGVATAFGQVAGRLNLRRPETEFERGIRRFGMLLTQVMVVLVLIVFTANVLSFKPPIDALLFAIALAVGISPELLPAIISINLSKGARTMAREGVIVRRLSAIENLGSMEVLCTDKTGTLTEGVVRLDSALAPDGSPSAEVLHWAGINARFQAGLANPLDEALAMAAPPLPAGIGKCDEIPFDFVRKRLGIVVQAGAQTTLIVKGAFDHVLEACSSVQIGAVRQPLDPACHERLSAQFADWSAQGFRVLGVAVSPVERKPAYQRDDEHDLTFIGFLRFFDPPKAGAAAAIAALAQRGVTVKIISGDNRFVTAHVAELVGLGGARIITGAALNQLPDEALWHAVTQHVHFAEVDPNQKERIIRALQKSGHVVGYMGDGINDAPALREADVGLSVEGAVDVAREAADIVLLQQDLDVLRRGIEQGRTTFANSLKYIFTTTSANFGNMLSMAAASLYLPFLPLLAKQILLNNFLSDIPAIALAGDRVDPEYTAAPQRWRIGFIRSFMIVFGLISSVFDLLMFALLQLVVRAGPELFRTAWFVESLLTELLVALVMRTRRPFFRSRPSGWLVGTTLGVGLLALAVPFLPGSAVLGFVPLPLPVLALILGITALYLLVTEFAKHWFYRRNANGSSCLIAGHSDGTPM